MSSSHPSFSGLPGERVKYFLAECDILYEGRGVDAIRLNEARIAAVLEGVHGAARDFVQSLDDATVEDWSLLKKALADRFPYFQPKEDEGEVIIRVQALKQGSRACHLHAKLQKANHLLLCNRWVRGLANGGARVTLLQRMQEWKTTPDPIPFEEFIHVAKFYVEEDVVPNPPEPTTDANVRFQGCHELKKSLQGP